MEISESTMKLKYSENTSDNFRFFSIYVLPLLTMSTILFCYTLPLEWMTKTYGYPTGYTKNGLVFSLQTFVGLLSFIPPLGLLLLGALRIYLRLRNIPDNQISYVYVAFMLIALHLVITIPAVSCTGFSPMSL